ncbi:MAG: glycosyltransferase family 9 protein [Calditrichota bacterium]
MPLETLNPASWMMPSSTTIVQLARLGDLIQSWPLLCALKNNSPNRRVNLVVDEDLTPIARLMTEPENVRGIPVKALKNIAAGGGRHSLTQALQEWTKELEALSADETINLNYHAPAALVAELIPASRRKGPQWGEVHQGKLPEGPLLELFRVNTGQRRGRRHLSDYWREYAGAPTSSFKYLYVEPAVRRRGDEFLDQQGLSADESFTAVIVGSGHPVRRWSIPGFQSIILELLKTTSVVLIGTASEEGISHEIIGGVPVAGAAGQLISLCGQTPLDILTGVLARSRLTVGVDTGALHLAAAIGTQCLGLFFGSMNFYETGPYGDAQTVLAPGGPDYPCLESEMIESRSKGADSIPVEWVTKTIRAILGFESSPNLAEGAWVSHLETEGCVWEPWIRE